MNKLIRNIAMLGMTGAILASCGQNILVGEDFTSGNEIKFDNGYIDNPVNTRSTGTTLLSEHMSTMGVWAWYTSGEEAEECLFLDQCIQYDTIEHVWSYSPKKYWSKKCEYLFNAYAPHSSEAKNQTVTINRKTRQFQIKGITLKGDNTMIGLTQPAPLGHFNKVDDIDWMIDRTGQDIEGANGNEVAFNMQHILSKLCVIADIERAGSKITIDSLSIGQFISKGDFSQDAEKTGEWTLFEAEPKYTIKSDDDIDITGKVCIVESLIFPQVTTADQKLTIHYTINDSSHFVAQFQLDEIFSQFLTANNYIITLTVGPEIIKFDGGVSDWDNQEIHHYVNN